MLQPVDRGDIVAACEDAYLRVSRAQYTLIVEEPFTKRQWSRRKVNFEMALEQANKVLAQIRAQEQTFAAGACPNCGHDFTAHSAWIANPGDRTCVTVDLIGSECDVWDELQAVPSYCERFVEDVADELAVLVIQCEGEIVHTDDKPFCLDPACPCHEDREAVNAVNEAVEAGILTASEASRFMAGKQV